jgi:predicted RNA-binding Zn-ribbon protein involved in translation (DUF1610 family)
MGDDACWLDRVCIECGRFIDDDDVRGDRCPHCGAELITEGPISRD